MTDVYIISTGISDTGVAQLENLIKKLPENLYKRVTETKNSELRLERALAYSLLNFVTAEEEVYFTEQGKPRLKSGEKYTSISHTGGACAVIVSDDGEVGIDIEAATEEAVTRSKKAMARFFPFANLNPSKLSDLAVDDVSIHYMSFKDDGITEDETSGYTVTEYSGPLYFWVSAEALLKADGRGFSAAGEVEKISYRAKKFYTTGIKLEESLLFLSLAVMEK